MRIPSTRLSWAVWALLAALLGSVSIALGQQAETPVLFPTTDQTSITDCSTPTVLNLSGGLTVTFSGGQFIHYKDANFDGTMYATSSAAGCQHLAFPPFADELGRPIAMIIVTFSSPGVASGTVDAYNFLDQEQFIGGDFSDGGNGADFPSMQFMSSPFQWPASPSPLTQSFAMETFTTTTQPDFTHTPASGVYLWKWDQLYRVTRA